MRRSKAQVSVVVLAGLVVGAFALGLATKTLLFRDSPPTARHVETATAPEVLVTPRVDPSGIPTGFARTRAGARAAAIAYVQLGDRVLSLDQGSAATVLGAIASRHSRAQFVRTELASFEQLRVALGRGAGPIHLRVGVVATRVDAYSDRRARVALWRVAVVSRDGMTSPGAQWALVTYDLVWESGSWRIWAETVAAGPAPADTDAHAATPAELEAVLEGFEPLGTP